MAAVTLREVEKVYAGSGRQAAYRALKGINLEVRDHEFMVLVGPSGCGKSTTLRVIAGLEEVSGGEIRIGDRVVNGVAPKDRDVAMVFQNYALYPHMTVEENLSFGLKLAGRPKAEIRARVGEAARILGLEELLGRKPKALSGGQRQRVAVGRAMVRKPQVFLFDEPLSNLDAKLRVTMRAEISRLHRSLQATMIYVTHDQVEAMTLGDRICVLRDGEIQQLAEPMVLYREPANLFVAGFIGNPPMNFLPGELEGSGGTLVLRVGETRLAWGLDGGAWPRKITLGLRPETVGVTRRAGDAGESGVHSAGEGVLPGVVAWVEPMGAETFLTVSAGGGEVVARVSGEASHERGEAVDLRFRWDRAHVFDPETGTRLNRG